MLFTAHNEQLKGFPNESPLPQQNCTTVKPTNFSFSHANHPTRSEIKLIYINNILQCLVSLLSQWRPQDLFRLCSSLEKNHRVS